MKHFLCCALLLSLGLRIWASPAFPELVRFHQPNSEIFVNIFLKGDEKVHWAESEDGYALLHGDDGSFCYAMRMDNGDLVASPYVATDIKERSDVVNAFLKQTQKHLTFSEAQVKELRALWKDLDRMNNGTKDGDALVGSRRFLVILFGFNDLEFTHNKIEFERLFNQVNYTANGVVGSVHDYYYECSYGQFSLQVDVAGPYTGVENMAHYGSTDDGYQDFAEEAVAYASEDVDFSDYDNDHDGYIDGLHIIFAGHGEEAGASSDCIWSHKWNIFSQPVYNNTVVNVYSCSPECASAYGTTLTHIGVICHEMGHVFGAPDYYDTDYAGSGGNFPGLGKWDIMSSGSWNRSGICPADHNPYTKVFIYHWATMDTLTDTQQVLMQNSMESKNDFHCITTSTNGDFFILQNRQQLKWDHNVPSHGLLVYHVHPNAHGASVTNYRHPQQLYILSNTTEAYPTADVSSYGDINDAVYPRLNGRMDSVTDYSVPALRSWTHALNNSPITFIRENTEDKTIAFCFKGGSPRPFSFDGEGVSDNKILLKWSRYGSYDYVIVMNPGTSCATLSSPAVEVGDTLEDNSTRVVYKGPANSTMVEGLPADSSFHFVIYMVLNDSTLSEPLACTVGTLACAATNWRNEDFEAYSSWSLPDCWTGDVSQPNEPNTNPNANCGYTLGWKVAQPELYASLNLLTSNALMGTASQHSAVTIECAPFALDSTGNMVLSFRMLGNLCSPEDSLEVLYRSASTEDWQVVNKVATKTSGWKEIFANLPSVGDYSRIGFRYSSTETGDLFIDDVQLTPGFLLSVSCNEGGRITPTGQSIVQKGDSIKFVMSHHPGYKLRRLRVDGTNRTVTHGDRVSVYRMAVKGSHTVFAEFERNLDIDGAENDQIKVFPNPTYDNVTVSLIHRCQLELFDITGRRLWVKADCEGDIVVPLAGMPNGLYLIKADSKVLKIIKK